MPKDDAGPAVRSDGLLETTALTAPVLAVGLGRGSSGKSTVLAEMIWRAQAQGRSPIVADGDARSKTLSHLFADATAPLSEEIADIKLWLTGLLNRAVKDQRSVVLDLGGGDRTLLEYGRDLRLVEFCDRRGIAPLGVYVLGPEAEDLSHIVSIWDAGYFRPKRSLLLLNEGTIREGRTVAGAFERTMNNPGFMRMVEGGAVPILLHRLAAMDAAKSVRGGFYEAATGDGLDPVEAFMVEAWLADLETKRQEAGALSWLP
jgi:hypothetical protein